MQKVTVHDEEIDALDALLTRAVDEMTYDLEADEADEAEIGKTPDSMLRLRAERLRFTATFVDAIGLHTLAEFAITAAEAHEERIETPEEEEV